MKVYKTTSGILIEHAGTFHLIEEDWDSFMNDDDLFLKLQKFSSSASTIQNENERAHHKILPPVGTQELWACGVTYLRSKVGRQEESKTAGGGYFYAKVYEAERPEIFF